jgi:hypothetical protein
MDRFLRAEIYYPLVYATASAKPFKSSKARHAFYKRTRAVIMAELQRFDPPLSDSELERERLALEAAISRTEDELSSAKFQLMTPTSPPVFDAAHAEDFSNRPLHKVSLSLPWWELNKNLLAALEEYNNRGQKNDGGRSAAIRALNGVLQFVDDVYVEDMLSENPCVKKDERFIIQLPLRALLLALEDLENGATGSIVDPADRDGLPGRPPNTFDRKRVMYDAAVTMSILMNIGYSAKDAGDTVAEFLQDCRFSLARDRTVSRRTIEKWRDQFRRPDHPQAEQFRKFTRQDAQTKFKETVRDQIRDRLLLRLLGGIVAYGTEAVEWGPTVLDLIRRNTKIIPPF